MKYFSTWIDRRANRVVNVDEFGELNDALEDAGILWRGTCPIQIIVTNEDGEVFAEFATP